MPVTLDEVRAFASALPRTTEGVVHQRVKFRVGRIVYLDFSRDETVMGFAFPKEWREVLIGSDPDKFLMPRTSDLRYNWVVRPHGGDRRGRDARARARRVGDGGAQEGRR